MPKTKTIYAIVIYDDGYCSSGEIKEYCLTEEIAKRELKKYKDFFCSSSPEPDERHIRKIEMVIE